jgi:anthranilate phosphoribosyltransferase
MSGRWPEVLGALVARHDLDAEQSAWAMEEILAGNATPAQIAGFAVALRAKGETVDEVEGLVRTMYAHAAPLGVPGRLVDIVGTGGDRARTVNISTMAAVVVAGTGAGWSSTATGPRRRPAGPPTCSRRSASA